MAKAKKLKSGNWNVRVTVQGKQYSFTDPDRRTVLRMAAAFADECRQAIDNPALRLRYSKASLERVKEFSREQKISEWEQMISELVNGAK